MTPVFRIVLIVVSLLSTYYILKKIRQSKLQIEYAIFWIVFAGVLVIISLFPWLVTLFTRLLGMQLPVNFVFMVFIFILLLKLFMMTIELSTLENKVKDLTQELALEEKEREDFSRLKARRIIGIPLSYRSPNRHPLGLFSHSERLLLRPEGPYFLMQTILRRMFLLAVSAFWMSITEHTQIHLQSILSKKS